jgi:hypothetical protein
MSTLHLQPRSIGIAKLCITITKESGQRGKSTTTFSRYIEVQSHSSAISTRSLSCSTPFLTHGQQMDGTQIGTPRFQTLTRPSSQSSTPSQKGRGIRDRALRATAGSLIQLPIFHLTPSWGCHTHSRSCHYPVKLWTAMAPETCAVIHSVASLSYVMLTTIEMFVLSDFRVSEKRRPCRDNGGVVWGGMERGILVNMREQLQEIWKVGKRQDSRRHQIQKRRTKEWGLQRA